MLKKISFLLLSLFTFLFILFLNGSITFFNTSIPPAGKLLNPFQGLWQCGEAKKPEAEKDLKIKGVKHPISIHYDERGVPHIYAQNMQDAIAAQGYVEAKDRAFQLDFTMRAASGRLSEVLGPVTLAMDKRNRKRGMVTASEKANDAMKKLGGYDYAESYSNGINAYISTLTEKSKPFETKFLNYDIEEWSPYKTVLIRNYMCEYLNSYSDDISNSNMLSIFGRDQFEDLYPLYNPSTYPIVTNQVIKDDQILNSDAVLNELVVDTFLDAYYQNTEEGIGSNNWAINAKNTKNGKPIYASDPHLTLNLPSIWYEMQIHTPEMHVHGVKIVGVPGLMMGFNEHIAWGETNLGHDHTDYFRIEWVDRKKGTYKLDGETKTTTQRIERIRVKGQADIVDTIHYTHWGPITHWSNDGTHDLSMKWIIQNTLEKPELETFVDMMKANSYSDYIKASSKFIGPPQNFGFASKDDSIAVRVNGDLPLRSQGDGRFVEEGNQSRNGWTNLIPRAQNPIIVNPEVGFVTSSNQRSTDDLYPYYYIGRFSDYRNKALDTFLRENKSFTLDDVAKLQSNSYSFLASELCPLLINGMRDSNLDDNENKLLTQLKNWDYYYKKDSKAATIFDEWYKELQHVVWDEIAIHRNKMDVRYPDTWRLIDLINTQNDHDFFDILNSPEKETANDCIREAFKQVVNSMNNKSEDELEWANFKPMTINHLLRIPGLGQKNVKTEGCKNCINATAKTFGPSWRMIVELGDKVVAKGIYPGGQSGNPTSKNYRTGIDKWSKGKYFDLELYKESSAIPSISSSITINPI